MSGRKVALTDIGLGYDPDGAPEPSTWAVMILDFGMAGAALRRRRAALTA